MIRADPDDWRLTISTGHTAPQARTISAARRQHHADRVLATYTVEHVRVLLGLARDEGRWRHVDWDAVAAGLESAVSGSDSAPGRSRTHERASQGRLW